MEKKKSPGRTRTNHEKMTQITVRVPLTVRNALKSKVNTHGFLSIAEYIRYLILNDIDWSGN